MRGFIIFLLVAALGFVYLRQRQGETVPAPKNSIVAQSVGTKPATTALTPAPRGQASEHNWMKRSLDRARDVTEQSRAQTQESQKP